MPKNLVSAAPAVNITKAALTSIFGNNAGTELFNPSPANPDALTVIPINIPKRNSSLSAICAAVIRLSG